MALFIPKNGSEFWGEFVLRTKRVRVPLHVAVRGQRPENLRLPGDPEFERSRARALIVLEKTIEELKDESREAGRLEKIQSILTGSKKELLGPQQLLEVWKQVPRKRDVSNEHVLNVSAVFRRFSEFMGAKKVRDLRAVSKAHAEEFMTAEWQRGVSGKTYNNVLGTMVAGFNAAASRCGLATNVFAHIPKRDENTIHRTPYAVPELEKILSWANADPLVGPVAITAACTGMRRRDCARLRWEQVDLKLNQVSVVTSKTRKLVEIPMFAPLRAILAGRDRKGTFCFPEAAEMYAVNSDGLNWRLTKLLERAGFGSEEIPKSEGQRLRAPARMGFHRFKTTFVSLALDGGVEMEMLRKIVGNKTVSVIRDSYYQPQRDDVNRVFISKMPSVLTGLKKAPPRALESALALAQSLAPDTVISLKPELLRLLQEALRPAKQN